MLNSLFDVVIVGSGPAGVNAAHPLVHDGLKVAIIDGGLDSKIKDEKLNDFSDINLSETSNAYGLIKNNSYIFNKTYQLLKIKSKIEIIQSLAKGGLSEFWHGISDFFSNSELDAIGLPADEIQSEYKEIAERIKLKFHLPLDLHNRLILQVSKNKVDLKSKVYRTPSAASYFCSKAIDELKKFKNFTYIPNRLVFKVKDKVRYVEIQTISIDKSLESTTRARFLILAAGSINTTRILLRSLGLFNYRATFLTKAHYIIACLHLRTLIKKRNFKQLKIGQLAISSNEINQGLSSFFIQIFRFSPSAIHKAVKYLPLPKSVALVLLRIIAPSLVFADIRFPAFESKGKFCRLKKSSDKKDILEIHFSETSKELKYHKTELSKVKQQLRTLGLFPLKTGSDYVTAHYAGGVPFKDKRSKLSVNKEGKLHYTRRIYIADSSTWRVLPGKSPTLTIMANAARVGKNVLRDFNRFRTTS